MAERRSTLPPSARPPDNLPSLSEERSIVFDVADDSPMFREKLNTLESDVADLKVHLQQLVKSVRASASAGQAYNEAQEQLATQLSALSFSGTKFEMDDLLLGPAIGKFSETIRQLNSIRQMLHGQSEMVFAAPMDEFINGDIKEAKEQRKRFDNAGNHYKTVLNRLLSLKKTAQASKVREAEQEVASAKLQFNLAGFDLATMLTDVKAKKKLEFLERLTAYMFAELSFFHQGFEMVSEIQPFMADLVAQLQAERAKFVAEQKALRVHRDDLAKTPAMRAAEAEARRRKNPREVEKQGYLFKRSSSVRKDWKRRWFVVMDGMLYYYRSWKDPQPNLALRLVLCTARPVHNVDKRFTFEIITPKRTLLLQASSQDDMDSWLTIIQNAIEATLSQTDPIDTNDPVSPHGGPVEADSVPQQRRRPTMSTAAASRTPIGLLLDVPGNDVCADCGTKGPEWASINLGVLICIGCSGIHRSLGVNHSKVRSLRLDKWEPSMLALMKALGNARVNMIFESTMQSQASKPTPSSDRAACERFIRAKYERKEYVTRPDGVSDADLGLRLFDASGDGALEVMLMCLALGADVGHRSGTDNATPLHNAAAHRQVLAGELLILYDANVDALDANGDSPLRRAVAADVPELVRVLLKAGARVQQQDVLSSTGHSSSVKQLLEVALDTTTATSSGGGAGMVSPSAMPQNVPATPDADAAAGDAERRRTASAGDSEDEREQRPWLYGEDAT